MAKDSGVDTDTKALYEWCRSKGYEQGFEDGVRHRQKEVWFIFLGCFAGALGGTLIALLR